MKFPEGRNGLKNLFNVFIKRVILVLTKLIIGLLIFGINFDKFCEKRKNGQQWQYLLLYKSICKNIYYLNYNIFI